MRIKQTSKRLVVCVKRITVKPSVTGLSQGAQWLSG